MLGGTGCTTQNKVNKTKQGKQHDIEWKRGDKVPTIRGEWVKIPLLPNKVGKKGQYNGHDKCYYNKKVKSPYNWVISPLTQPHVAYQQKEKKKTISFEKRRWVPCIFS